MKKFAIILTALVLIPGINNAQDTYSFLSGAVPAIVGNDTLWGGTGASGSRGVCAGSDIDHDGKYEVFACNYDKHQVYGFEYAGGDTMELIWESKVADADYSTPRDVHVADLDGDGNQEVIFCIGRHPSGDSSLDDGVQIYEWDGSDNGLPSEPSYQINFLDALNDSLYESRVEGFSVGDIDGDGQDELLIANNGTYNSAFGTVNGSTPYSGDRFMILSVNNIGDFGTTVTEEYAMSPRDVDKDGVIESNLGGGSPQDIVICDTDGDGHMEAACLSWNNEALFFIEATGPDAYTIGDTGWVKLTVNDDWTLGASVADMDGDGKDEVYIPGFYDGKLFVVTDADGDATSLDTTGMGDKSWAGNSEIAFHTLTGYALGTSSFNTTVFGGSNGGDFYSVNLASGGSPLDTADWNVESYDFADSYGGGVNKLAAGVDFDTDGYIESVLAYQGVPDSIEVINGTDTSMAVNPAPWVIRVVESGTVMSVHDMTVITPNQYKLSQNYPNPFNPTTSINFSLPIANKVSLVIYNMLGQEVTRLVDNEYRPAGDYTAQWNGTNSAGISVSSGTYIYQLKYGNFSLTKQMTLLK